MALTRPSFNNINSNVSARFNDPLVVLNSANVSANNQDIGFIFNRGVSGNVALVWNETVDSFVLAHTSTSGITDGNITVTSNANLRLGNLTTVGTSTFAGNMTVGHILPSANAAYDLGSPTVRFRTLYITGNTIDMGGATIKATDRGFRMESKSGSKFDFDDDLGFYQNTTSTNNAGTFSNLVVSGTATITGNLLVNGTTTTINSSSLTVNDKNIVVANNQSSSSTIDGAGIDAGGGTPIATWRYNHSTTSWQSNVGITPSANNSVALGGTSNWWSNAYATNIYGTLQTASQTNITGVGNITTGTWSGTTIATNKGGTGLTSFTSGGAVYASSSSALTTGTLPVASGGTGVTTSTGSGSVVLSASPTLTGTLTAATINAAAIGNSGATLTGTIQTAAQTNITSVGTLTGLTMSGTLTGTTINAATIGNTGSALVGSTVSAATIGNTGTTLVSTTANISGNATLSGNVTAGNVFANGYFYANGIPYGGSGGNPSGSNTQIQYNNNGVFGGASGLTTNGTNLTVTAGIQNTPIGNTTANTGAFTTLSATGTFTGTTINAATIGNSGATLTGTLQTASQTNITGIGNVTTGTWSATAVGLAYGGTGATSAATARTNLGLAIGTDVQAYNATLAAVASGTYTGDDHIVTVGNVTTGTWNGTAIADGKIVSALTGKTYNGLTLTAATTGFTIAGGTTSKTLTVNNTLALSGTDSSTLNIGSGGTLGSAAFTASSAYATSGHTHSGTYEPVITAGTTGQYWRGDKTWQTLNSTAVGLGSVENTALSTWAGTTNITTLGNITTGTWNGTAIALGKLAASTISGVSLGNNLNSLTVNNGGAGTASGGTYNGSSAVTISHNSIGAAPQAGNSSIVTVGTISSGTWNGTAVGLAYGGTGQTTAQLALKALAGNTTTSGSYLRGNGTAIVMSTIQVADVPTLNQNTTGSAGSVTNALTFNNGGAGAASASTYNGSSAVTISHNTIGAAPQAGNTSIVTVGNIASGTWSATAVGLAYGGTGASTAATARTNLGLAIGTDVQAYNATLATVAAGTYTGSTSIVTLGNITTGTWNGTAIATAKLAASTISGVTLGSNLNTLTLGSYLTGTSYNGSAAVTAAVDATTAATASKIVARDANGDINSRYCNATYLNSSDDVNTGSVTYLMAKFGDNYLRSASAAKVATFLSGQTMNIAGTASSETLATVTSRGAQATGSMSVATGEGYGYVFWNDSTNYKIHMGSTAGTYQYGPVTDYSMRFTMGSGTGRGFTWGYAGSAPIAALNAYTGNMQIAGTFSAASKSFLIPHPTKPGKQLRYGSLEGPENGVYVRGKLTGNNTIELPEYWTKLVDPDSITVTLTPIGKHQNLFVESVSINQVVVGNSNLFGKDINCFFVVYGERIDIDKLVVEE